MVDTVHAPVNTNYRTRTLITSNQWGLEECRMLLALGERTFYGQGVSATLCTQLQRCL